MANLEITLTLPEAINMLVILKTLPSADKSVQSHDISIKCNDTNFELAWENWFCRRLNWLSQAIFRHSCTHSSVNNFDIKL